MNFPDLKRFWWNGFVWLPFAMLALFIPWIPLQIFADFPINGSESDIFGSGFSTALSIIYLFIAYPIFVGLIASRYQPYLGELPILSLKQKFLLQFLSITFGLIFISLFVAFFYLHNGGFIYLGMALSLLLIAFFCRNLPTSDNSDKPDPPNQTVQETGTVPRDD